MHTDYIIRHENNPVISKATLPYEAQCVFNSGAALFDGKIYMILNTWTREWVPKFVVAHSEDGIHFTVEDDEVLGIPNEYPYCRIGGAFDTRITEIDGTYFITYNVSSSVGGRIRLTSTRDFKTFEELGYISQPDQRNCVIFPEKFNGDYVRLERPNGENGLGEIFISYSKDLVDWGRTKLLLQKGFRYWESHKIGPGAPPVKTDKGWLVIYHGCREHMNGIMYNAGCMLLDLKDPSKIIGKMKDCLFWPERDYETSGNVPQVVFPTAALIHPSKDELKIYYGAADTSICLATASLSFLVEKCLEDGPLVYPQPDA
jgi:predicted GH43/DUF377 family glycosyl hydrolase